jgi:hypothetical protein
MLVTGTLAFDRRPLHAVRDMHLSTLIPTLQLAVGPVILISGIGLLLLSMTTRFGRTIDRTREIASV